jgi:peptidoglycan hydrolase-like protein with peptidoglycan-binding domain
MVARKSRDLSKVVNFVLPSFAHVVVAAAAHPGAAPVVARPRPPAFAGKIIKIGATNDPVVVRQIKARLNVIFRGHVPANDNHPFKGSPAYGDKTAGAVADFQARSHILVDGEVGEDTWAKLFG